MASKPAVDPLIRLIGIDVDGTLIGSTGIIAERVWDTAARARAAGIHLALCSGRPAFGVALEYARRLDGESWHIFQNGASIVHLASGRSLSVNLPAQPVQELIAQARSTQHVLELYSDTEYATESTSAWAREHAQLLGLRFEPRSFESLQAPIVRAQWLLSPADAARAFVRAPMGLEVAESTSPLMPETRFVGLTAEGVNKGSAICRVAMECGVSMQHVMYVGDSGNDLSAMRVAGYPIAMANADRDVRRAARCSVGHVDEGGLADALEIAIAATRA